MIQMTFKDVQDKLEELGFDPNVTKLIKCGLSAFSAFKKELGSIANSYMGVPFILDSSLQKEEIVLI